MPQSINPPHGNSPGGPPSMAPHGGPPPMAPRHGGPPPMMPSHRSRRNLFPPVVVQPNPVVIHDSPRSEVTVYSSKRSGCIAAGIVCLIAAVVFFSIPVPFFWIAGLCLSAAFIACIAASFFVDSFGSSNNGQLNISQGLDDEHHEIGLNRDIEREKESQTQEKHEKSDFDVRVPNVDKVHEI